MKGNQKWPRGRAIFYPGLKVALTVIHWNHIFRRIRLRTKNTDVFRLRFSPLSLHTTLQIDLLILGALVVWILDKHRRNLIPMVFRMQTQKCDIYIRLYAVFTLILYYTGQKLAFSNNPQINNQNSENANFFVISQR